MFAVIAILWEAVMYDTSVCVSTELRALSCYQQKVHSTLVAELPFPALSDKDA
jgi:hypothetical protein